MNAPVWQDPTVRIYGDVHLGEGVVMAAGIPPNQSASTNIMKLHSVGSTTIGTPQG